MSGHRYVFLLVLLSASTGFLRPQATRETQPGKSTERDIDPLALDVLKAVTQPIEQAQAFSFEALVSEEQLASNGQIVTLFHSTKIAVQRPDKVHLIFKGRGDRVDYYETKESITMYAPDAKLYSTIAAKDTIDENLAVLSKRGVDMPLGPFLNSRLYELASKNLITAYVIGRVKIYDKEVHQLAFTARDADWQLWATGGEAPRIVRVEVVNKKLEGKPRTIIQFLDWNLSPTLSPDEFHFSKPADAHEIAIMSDTGEVVK